MIITDNISINSAVLEEMCRAEDESMDTTEDEDNEEIPEPELEPIARSITMVCSQARQRRQNNRQNESPASVQTLEQSYSQLSLEKEDDPTPVNSPMNSPPASPVNSPIEVQVIVEPPKPKESPVRRTTSMLKNQSILRKPKTTVEKSEGPPDEKKPRIDDERNHSRKRSPTTPVQNRREEPRELPKVQSIETIARPIAVAAKPLVAEVTPTPSNLFSPKCYAPSSCASIDDLDLEYDTNLEDTPGE